MKTKIFKLSNINYSISVNSSSEYFIKNKRYKIIAFEYHYKELWAIVISEQGRFVISPEYPGLNIFYPLHLQLSFDF